MFRAERKSSTRTALRTDHKFRIGFRGPGMVPEPRIMSRDLIPEISKIPIMEYENHRLSITIDTTIRGFLFA
jgi:hypothetical protein